jgi:outer membrane beta-barrel protein
MKEDQPMTHRISQRMTQRLALGFLFASMFLALPLTANAQRRSPLADAPAIRKRVELRQSRFELGAGLGSTVNETFYHGILADVHLGFHITDWLSLSALGTFNVSTISTGFNDELQSRLPPSTNADMPRTPTRTDALRGMNKASSILAARIEVTPFTGKYSLFGSYFAHYDFYLFAGPAVVNLAAVTPTAGTVTCGDQPNPSSATCLVSGSKIGGLGGIGFHSFFNDFLALSIELRDVFIKDNPAGRGVVVTGVLDGSGGQPEVSNKDLSWSSHLMAILGLTLYLPATAGISP